MRNDDLRACTRSSNYHIYRDGRVATRRRSGSAGGFLKQFIKSRRRGKTPYRHVGICVAGVQRNVKVHVLVLEAFHGPQPEGMESRHLDGNSLNNHASNLVWGTPLQNAADRAAHGKTARGEKQGQSKLTEAAVRDIRSHPEVLRRVMAKKHRISPENISTIITGRTWKHVKAEA